VSETVELPGSKRAVAVLTTLVLAVATFLTGAAVAPSAGASTTEAAVTSKLNGARSAYGRPRLTVRSDLVSVARAQAARMASQDRLYHNPNLARDVRNYRWAGENVGYGPSVALVHSAFMNSPGHKANILDRDYTEVGVGAVWRNGRVWIAEVFRQPLHRTSASSSFHYLRYGSTGSRVAQVQRRLGVRPTGYFGRVTRAKVAAFQRRQGWRGSGVVGPKTWHRLGL
jgi:peptidoglycan hydrolase-like protein with peptidoglycan-binding domain